MNEKDKELEQIEGSTEDSDDQNPDEQCCCCVVDPCGCFLDSSCCC